VDGEEEESVDALDLEESELDEDELFDALE